jgi:hypothetical protein
MYCPSLQHQPNSAKSTGLLKSLKPIETAAKYYTIQLVKTIETRLGDAPRPAHDFIPQISCTAPACNVSQIQPNPLACSNRSNPSKQPPNITLQLGKLVINAARRRSAHTTRFPTTNPIYHGKTYNITSFTPLYIVILHTVVYSPYSTTAFGVHVYTSNVTHVELSIENSHISYRNLCFAYVFTATYMYM